MIDVKINLTCFFQFVKKNIKYTTNHRSSLKFIRCPILIQICNCWGLLRVSPTLVNLVEDRGFISEEYYLHWNEVWEVMLKVDNIILLWRVVIPNMILESCSNLSHDNRFLKYRTKNCEPWRCCQKWLKCQTNGVLCSKAWEKGVESRLRGGL